MGGAQAMSTGLRHPDTFGWIGSLSGAFQMVTSTTTSALPDPMEMALEPKRFSLVYIGYGANDAGLAPLSRQLAGDLKAKGFRVSSVEVPGLGHVWPLWRQLIGDLLQLLFQTPVAANAALL